MSDRANNPSKKARFQLGSAICFALAAFVFPLATIEGRGRDWIRIFIGCLYALVALLQFLAYRRAVRSQVR